ncbi:hypothetical protein Agub_g10504 [Astrephomene gubernaculifera]|uniref:Glycosyl transferase CAP10 domain-containing protein n=1 Tax=Astrephomene gubernaculifera TaxID=47775 RepID=A0AAD3DV04_9CHLO|nr:hypothetical protein Agub_g10504 [Astrephomene gubernaculifera]
MAAMTRFQWLASVLLAAMRVGSAFLIKDQPRIGGSALDILTPSVGMPQVDQEEWATFLTENLDRDISPWQARAPLSPADILSQHQTLLNGTGRPDVFLLVLIYNNRIYYPNRTDVDNTEPPASISPHAAAFHRKVTSLLASGRRQLPNALFVYSFEDNQPRFCSPSSQYCRRVPLISQVKTLGEPDGDDLDILVPQWLYTPSQLYMHPWHLKKDLAFFRGEPFCSSYWWDRYRCHDACPRTALAQLAARDMAAGNASVLDVGLLRGVERERGADGQPLTRFRCLKQDLPALQWVSLPEHSRYRWLLHLEGLTASSRLSQLMLVNSVVVLQRQPFVEYFYRSLKPHVHYVPFWNATDEWFMADIYDVIGELRRWDASDPRAIQRIIREAQNFALKFTLPAARLQYLRDALTAYRELFPSMDSFLEEYVAGLRQRGFRIDEEKEVLRAATAAAVAASGTVVRSSGGGGGARRAGHRRRIVVTAAAGKRR